MLMCSALLVGIAPDAFAPDYSSLEILGFSEDGNFFAFEQYGMVAGSGSPYSWIAFLDVRADRPPAETTQIRIGGGEGFPLSLEETRERAREEARPTLEKLRIEKENAGDRVLIRPLTDLVADSTKARFSVWPRLQGFLSQDYSVLIEARETESERCYFGEKPYIFDLTLRNNRTGEEKLLHHDEELPRERGCTRGYRIAEIYVYNTTTEYDPAKGEDSVIGAPMVVFLHVISTGFEGHDMRFLAVGGLLH
jgi:predicted secreted protein